MRQDEAGNPCPETLREYRDLCEAMGMPGNGAVKLLDSRIEDFGRDEPVITTDSQMRALLMPLLLTV